MKYMASHRPTRRTAGFGSERIPSAGPGGLSAIDPPAYGIDFVDRATASYGDLMSQPGEVTLAGIPAQRAPSPGSEAASAPGIENRTGMPDRLKGGLERLSGLDLSGVRVRYNSAKPARLNARAYTQGRDIEVGPGQEKHLPHEGWHAVQQIQGRVEPTTQAHGVSINDDEGLEREAETMGAKALRMRLNDCCVSSYDTNGRSRANQDSFHVTRSKRYKGLSGTRKPDPVSSDRSAMQLMGLTDLDKDVMGEILKYLSLSELAQLSLVSKGALEWARLRLAPEYANLVDKYKKFIETDLEVKNVADGLAKENKPDEGKLERIDKTVKLEWQRILFNLALVDAFAKSVAEEYHLDSGEVWKRVARYLEEKFFLPKFRAGAVIEELMSFNVFDPSLISPGSVG